MSRPDTVAAVPGRVRRYPRHTIPVCPRCGFRHDNVEFAPFTRTLHVADTDIVYTHWALCPANGEPILRRLEEPAG